MKNIFYVDEVSELINLHNDNKITIGRLTELLNEKATQIFKPDVKSSKVFSRDECVFKYCPNAELCQKKCINTD